ncbi:MAG TPA: TRAP transporter substrate-binding protein [Stellaceae bacterium]|nr:TRAP transporter substrate-binding protein [Stellaceae bacterium]
MIRRREVLKSVAAVGTILGVSFARARGAAADDKIVLTVFDTERDGSPTVEAVARMGKRVADASGGRITIQRYTANRIARESEAIEQLQVGALQLARVSVQSLWPIVDDLNVLNLPFLFRNTAHMNETVDGEVGKLLLDEISSNPEARLVGLCWMDAGARNIYDNKRAIDSVADMKGLRIRVTGNPILLDMIEDLGGHGVAMRYDGVLPALKSGEIDGAENNMPTYAADKHYEVAKYYNLTEHLIVPEILVASGVTWQTLSEDDRALIRKYAHQAQREERDLWHAAEEQALAELKKAGVDIVPVDDKEAFRNAVKPVWEKYGGKYAALVKSIDEVG